MIQIYILGLCVLCVLAPVKSPDDATEHDITDNLYTINNRSNNLSR